ncbi:MAG: hypothetical protein V1799_07855 [bacterium]
MVQTTKEISKVAGVHPLDNVSTEDVGSVLSKKEIKQAFDEERRILDEKQNILLLFFSLGRRLKNIRDNRWYKVLGFNSFSEWTENSDVDIERATAYRYIKIFEVYIESGAFTESEVAGRSISKLEIIIPYVDVQGKGWNKTKAKLLGLLDLTRVDLVKSLNEQGDTRYNSPHNAKGGFVVDAKYSVDEKSGTSARNQEQERTDREVVSIANSNEKGKTEVSLTEATKKIGLSGWYEMIATAEPAQRGREIKGVYITTEKVVVSGNRIFINVE